MANRSSRAWDNHNSRLLDAMRAEEEKAKPMKDAMRLMLGMMMGGLGKPIVESKPTVKRAKRSKQP